MIVLVIIVGLTVTAYAQTFGFVKNGSSYNLFLYPGSADTWPWGINNSDQIVGAYDSGDGVLHGFLKDGNTFTSFDYPGSTSTFPYGINNSGQIVGAYADEGMEGIARKMLGVVF